MQSPQRTVFTATCKPMNLVILRVNDAPSAPALRSASAALRIARLVTEPRSDRRNNCSLATCRSYVLTYVKIDCLKSMHWCVDMRCHVREHRYVERIKAYAKSKHLRGSAGRNYRPARS